MTERRFKRIGRAASSVGVASVALLVVTAMVSCGYRLGAAIGAMSTTETVTWWAIHLLFSPAPLLAAGAVAGYVRRSKSRAAPARASESKSSSNI